MREIKFYKDTVVKAYENDEITKKEFLSMLHIEKSLLNKRVDKINYRALKVIDYKPNNGYSMEKIKGKTLSEYFWESRDIEIFLLGVKWLAIFANSFSSKKIPYLSDYTTHNIMLSGQNDVVVIDQAGALDELVEVERILSYYLARFSLELSLKFKGSKKFLTNAINNYNSIAINKLDLNRLKNEISQSNLRLKKKIKRNLKGSKKLIIISLLNLNRLYFNFILLNT